MLILGRILKNKLFEVSRHAHVMSVGRRAFAKYPFNGYPDNRCGELSNRFQYICRAYANMKIIKFSPYMDRDGEAHELRSLGTGLQI